MRSDWLELQALIDEGRFDDVYASASLEEIADEWLAYHRQDEHPDNPKDDPRWWAVDLLSEESFDAERRQRLLRLLIDKAEDERMLGNVAAGPLENYVGLDEPSLDWVERSAKESERFRRALTKVWLWREPDAVFDRVERAAGAPLPRPDREEYDRRMGRS